MKYHRVALTWIIFLAAVWLFFGRRFSDAWQWNWINLRLISGQDVSAFIEASGCSNVWLKNMAVSKRGDLSAQRQALSLSLRCSPEYLSLIQAVLPEDQEMARLATQYYSQNSATWFWLGETLAYTDKTAAHEAYLQTVELAPRNGLAWCRLGQQYEAMSEIESAADAFLNCCLYGDPGSHGCYGAGRMMEELGNIPQAIIYYRYSNFDKALDRADELETQVIP